MSMTSADAQPTLTLRDVAMMDAALRLLMAPHVSDAPEIVRRLYGEAILKAALRYLGPKGVP